MNEVTVKEGLIDIVKKGLSNKYTYEEINELREAIIIRNIGSNKDTLYNKDTLNKEK